MGDSKEEKKKLVKTFAAQGLYIDMHLNTWLKKKKTNAIP